MRKNTVPNTSERMFWESAKKNTELYQYYYNLLMNIYLARFEWKNLPTTVDQRFLELALFASGMAVFFEDDGGLGFLALRSLISGPLNVYNLPTKRTAYAANGYQRQLDESNSVMIFNDYMHMPSMQNIQLFASDLAEIMRTIQVNIKAQKTPVLIKCTETQRLTMKNLYKQYDGNEPFIFGDKGLDENAFKVLKTDAPFIALELYTAFEKKWNEAMTYIGIANLSTNKKERLITDEVQKTMGGTIACRFSALGMRQQACEQINNLFGLNVWCEMRDEIVNADSLDESNDGEDEEEQFKEVDGNE